jgi:Arsenite-resistance protein 2
VSFSIVINVFYLSRLLSRELSKVVEQFIKQEDEGRFRCKTCQKLFKATSFVEKHIANKHSELVKSLEDVNIITIHRAFD